MTWWKIYFILAAVRIQYIRYQILLNISTANNLLMAKKRVTKKTKRERKSISQQTIEEGQEFVTLSFRLHNRKTAASRMSTSQKKAVKSHRKQSSRKPLSKVKVTKTMKEIVKGTSKKIKKSAATTKKKAKPAAKQSAPVAVPPAPAAHLGGRTSSLKSKTLNKDNKITAFKTKSKDNLMIPAFGFIDVCFCVDATGSMSCQLAQVQSIIQAIIHNIENKVRTQGLQLRFAIVTYRDHPPQDSTYVTKIQDFTDNFEAIAYVKTLTAGGGGDEPEAVHDGLFDAATKLNWAMVDSTPVLRYIFHVADAPPHGKQFLNPDSRQGCLCGMQTDDVMREINKKQIHYRLIKVRQNEKVNKMEQIFRAKLANFDSTDIGHASEMNVKVSDMIIHEVLPDFA